MAATERGQVVTGRQSGTVATTIIPGCQNLKGYWAPGHGIMVHTSDGKPKSAQGSTHYRYPVLHEVCWGADLQSTITRKLINETHAIFVDLQDLPDAGGMGRKTNLIKISRRYRSVIRACILDLEEKDGDARQPSPGSLQSSVSQRHLLTLIETVWHLSEILFIKTLPGGAVLHHLLEWVQNGHADKYVGDILQHSIPHDSPSYWPAIYSLVLQGRVNHVRELLADHPDKQTGEYDDFESMDELLRKMPMYQLYMGQTLQEFTMKWNHWQQECKHRLKNETYAGNPHLNTLCQILCGEEEVFDEMLEYCKTWYHLLVAKLLYCNPAIKSFDLQYHTQSCIDKFGGNANLRNFDRILMSAFEFDVHAVIKESSDALGNWWFVAHLTDLLHHCGQLDTHHISHSISLREFLILEYAASLVSNHSLWRVAVDYLLQCPVYGRAHLVEYIEHLPLETDKKAMKVLRLCEDLDMLAQAQSICKTMSMKAMKSGRLGAALAWCLRSKDSTFAAFISERFLAEYCQSGGFSNLDLIDHLGSAMLLSDRLTFLGKYREFHMLYEEGKFHEAAHLLISLLTSKLAPQRLWLTLLTDSIPLLEHEEIIFSSSQTYELMHCLDEIRLSFRTKEYLGHPSEEPSDESSVRPAAMGPGMKSLKSTKAQEDEERDKIELIRLALARNLSRTIL
ncbi:nuclear pore complex protein Nup85-like [Montipora capricornis]|uniref:nuclear pore complex protein Nup85-like n=1 Tax=Montipora capricornis TaxID=246305 RepID=UPI0035F1B1F8